MLALIPAGGVGTRLGAAIAKQYLPVAGGMSMLEASARALLAAPWIDQVLIVVAQDDPLQGPIQQRLQGEFGGRIAVLAEAGPTRRDTVLAGLEHLLRQCDEAATTWVLVHDAARPGLQAQDLERLRAAVLADPLRSGGLLALPISDTVKSIGAGTDGAGLAADAITTSAPRSALTLDRRLLWAAQTPQMFPLASLARALRAQEAVTDEASAMELAGVQPLLVEGSRRNFKVTTREDLDWMRLLLDAAADPSR